MASGLKDVGCPNQRQVKTKQTTYPRTCIVYRTITLWHDSQWMTSIEGSKPCTTAIMVRQRTPQALHNAINAYVLALRTGEGALVHAGGALAALGDVGAMGLARC